MEKPGRACLKWLKFLCPGIRHLNARRLPRKTSIISVDCCPQNKSLKSNQTNSNWGKFYKRKGQYSSQVSTSWKTKKGWGTIQIQKRLRRHENYMQCVILDWILDQEKNSQTDYYWDKWQNLSMSYGFNNSIESM